MTGIFTPVDGLYSMTYSATIATNAGVTEIGARLVDDLGTTIYTSVVQTTDLFSPETGLEGAQYENLVAYFVTGRTYTLHAKIDANETMDFHVTISRIM